MNDKKNIEKPVTGGDTDQTRRTLTKAALTLPITASLAPRAAFGCSVSGFLSGNVSENHGPHTCEGNGCTPGFWKNNVEAWPLHSFSPGVCGTYNTNEGNGQVTCSQWNPSITGGATAISSMAPESCADDFASFVGGYGYDYLTTSIMEILLKEVKGSGNTNSILAHYIAAILNSASSQIVYGTSIAEIKEAFCKAYSENKLEEFKDILDVLNNRGCFLDAHGNCEEGFVLYDRACIPASTCTQTDSNGECVSIDPITP